MTAKKRKDTLQGLIPAVNTVLEEPALAGLLKDLDHDFVVGRVREVIDAARARLQNGEETVLSAADAAGKAAAAIHRLLNLRMRRVVNATGTVIHTGLGRAVFPAAVREALNGALAGYSFVQTEQEDLDRVVRERFIIELFRALTGSETAVVVNNNAAAVFLLLKSAAAGREVIISRGELVEIGGSFRIPDVMAQGGVKLVEVGTTNRTRIDDYRKAITPATAALMVVHRSNYRIEGFTASPSVKELADLAHEHKLLMIHDLGSGTMVDLNRAIPCDEPLVRESLAAGADIISCSTDKVLGGPQGGVILGRRELVEPMRKDPFFRILRPCKMTLIALEATLALYARKTGEIYKDIPVLEMFSRTSEQLAAAADDLAARLGTIKALTVQVIDTFSTSGGGALPAIEIPTRAVTVTCKGMKARDLSYRLRTAPGIPVLARISDEKLILDPRTLLAGEADLVVKAFGKAVEGAISEMKSDI